MVIRSAVFAVGVLLLAAPAWPADRPVFQVDVPYPTKDKPQSKLWFAHGTWWAWLPVRGGSSVWRRSGAGWQRQTHLDRALQGLPGQADVWADEDTARAVLVEPDRVAVVGLRWDKAAGRYEPAEPAVQFRIEGPPGKKGGIETATIARDGRGRWWIAYDWQRDMFVRWSADNGRDWSGPMAVNRSKADEDDICAIVALPDRVGMIWSDQATDAVYFRAHADGTPPGSWLAVEIAAQGGETADDHIHTAVAKDGTLYVATKNSVDTVGEPQQVLRVRDPRGKWTNHPYAVRTKMYQPSRPIVLLGGDPERLLLLHSLYRMDHPKPPQSVIAWQTTDLLPRLNLMPEARPLLDAGTRLNDVTSCKGRLPAGQTWIVLAADEAGNVYEARLN